MEYRIGGRGRPGGASPDSLVTSWRSASASKSAATPSRSSSAWKANRCTSSAAHRVAHRRALLRRHRVLLAPAGQVRYGRALQRRSREFSGKSTVAVCLPHSRTSLPPLEVELERKLDVARRAERARHDAARRRIDITPRRIERRTIRQIERLCAELNAQALARLERLEEREIEVLEAVGAEDERPRISVSVISRRREIGLVEPIRESWDRKAGPSRCDSETARRCPYSTRRARWSA